MSRTGKKPVAVPAGVTAAIADGQLSVKGPKGTLAMPLADEVTYSIEDGTIAVKPANDSKRARAFWGMQRTLIANLITGVTEGFSKKLLITGVGYRANAQGKTLRAITTGGSTAILPAGQKVRLIPPPVLHLLRTYRPGNGGRP